MDFKNSEDHPATQPSAVKMVRALINHSDLKTEVSKVPAFGPVTTVSIAMRLKLFANATNSQVANGVVALLQEHAVEGDLACKLLLNDLRKVSGVIDHGQK